MKMTSQARLERIEPITLDKKFGGMLLLSTFVSIISISLIDNLPQGINIHNEFHYFASIWITLGSLTLLWTFIMDPNPPPMTIKNVLELAWATSLLSAFFIFVNHFNELNKMAKIYWGCMAGPFLLGLSFAAWLFIVLSYHLGRYQAQVEDDEDD